MQFYQKKYDRLALQLFVMMITAFLYTWVAHVISLQWTLDASGISLLNQKLPEWDFTNLWVGGTLAISGQLETLFEIPRYRAFLNGFFYATLGHHEWSYPPHMLLLGAPLSLLHMRTAYLLWSAGTWALLLGFLYLQKMDVKHRILILFSPAMITSIMIGQNGALTAFLLLGCLYWARPRPMLAGLLLGILTIKPHLCLIAGIALLATRNWHALAFAALTMLAMGTVTTIWFGSHIWYLWVMNTVPFMTQLMECPHPQPGMLLSVTLFYALRDLGLSIGISYMLQGVVTLGCVGAAWKLWRNDEVTLPIKLAITTMLTLLSTPYAHGYDMTVTAYACAVLIDAPGNSRRISLYLLWILPFLISDLNQAGLVIAPLILIAPILLCYPYRRTTAVASHR